MGGRYRSGTDNDPRILISPNEGPRSYVVSLPLSMRAPAVAMGDVNGNGTTDIWALVGAVCTGVRGRGRGTFNRLGITPSARWHVVRMSASVLRTLSRMAAVTFPSL